MKVLLISLSLGKGSGAERVLEYLLEGIPLESRADYALLAPPTSALYIRAQELAYFVHAWDSPDNSFIGNLNAYFKFSRNSIQHYQILHVWHTRCFEWGLFLKSKRQIVFGTLHDSPQAPQISFLRKWVMKASAHRLDQLVVVSHALKTVCLDSRWTCDPLVIHNGLPEASPVELNPGHSFRISFMGLIEPWKGFSIIENILESGNCPKNWVFQIFGNPNPNLVLSLKTLAERFPEQVIIKGYALPSEIFSITDVLLHPSLQFDPYPTILLEAARAGIPVVASRVGGTSEIVDHEKTGLIFEPSSWQEALDALKYFHSHPDFSIELAQNSRAKFEKKFRVSSMVEKYSQLWNS